MANRYQAFPYHSMNNIQNDYNAMLKIYKPFSHGYPNLYKTKGYMTNNEKGSPIHAIFRVHLNEYQKGFDSVDDFDFDTPESDS